MGLYADISTSLVTAFDGDLADATKTIQVVEFGSPVYNPTTRQSTSSETNYDVRAVPMTRKDGEIMDENGEMFDAKFLVLDTEKQVSAFTLKMRINLDGVSYRIDGVNRDPAGISWMLYCRKWA